MAHTKPTTKLDIYAHLFEDNHADAMAVLGAMSAESEGRECGGNAGAAMNAVDAVLLCSP